MKKIDPEQLGRLFDAPEPERKRAFLRQLPIRPVNIRQILCQQYFYISKWARLPVIFLLMVILYLYLFHRSELLPATLALMPFLAVTVATESMRSVLHGMEELEAVSRFSLKSVLLARMGILGIENLFLAFLAALLSGENFYCSVIYLFTPYFLTAYGCFVTVRKLPGKESVYCCAGLAASVCALTGFGTNIFRWLFQDRYIPLWILAAAAFFCMVLTESRKMVRWAETCKGL